jgi:hypothetical protein
LAEEILSGYFAIRNKIRDERKRWLDEKNKVQEDINRNDRTIENIQKARQSSLYMRIQQQKSGKKITQRMLADEYEEATAKEKSGKTGASIERMPERPARPLTARRPQSCKKAPVDSGFVKSTFHGRVTLKAYRREIHPPSKLVISNKEQLYERNLTMKIDDQMLKTDVEKAYKIHVLKDQKDIDQGKFSKTYSGGPLSVNPEVEITDVAIERNEDKGCSFNTEVLEGYNGKKSIRKNQRNQSSTETSSLEIWQE